MGPYFRRYRTISGNIGQYPAISSNIKVIFISVKSVMSWVRSKSSPTGSVNYKPNMVRPCRIRTVMILLKITDIGHYRCCCNTVTPSGKLFIFIIIFINFFRKRKKRNSLIKHFGVMIFCTIFSFSVDYFFDNIIKQHQKNRISLWLKLENNPEEIEKMKRTILYNLNESE